MPVTLESACWLPPELPKVGRWQFVWCCLDHRKAGRPSWSSISSLFLCSSFEVFSWCVSGTSVDHGPTGAGAWEWWRVFNFFFKAVFSVTWPPFCNKALFVPAICSSSTPTRVHGQVIQYCQRQGLTSQKLSLTLTLRHCSCSCYCLPLLLYWKTNKMHQGVDRSFLQLHNFVTV